MNIEYNDISAFKRYNLPDLIQSYGIEVKRRSGGWIARCPFHDDNNPSLSINQKDGIWLWHCFGCGASGTVIDFVMKKETLTLAETYEKLRLLVSCSAGIAPCDDGGSAGLNSLELLRKVSGFYHKTFFEDGKALDYLVGRGLKSEELYKTFKIGYANGTLKRTLPLRGAMIAALKEIGILNEKGNEFFYGCVVVPMFDEDGNVVSLYGRSITGSNHLYVKGAHKGLINRQGAYNADKVIFTEAVIDALSLYEMGERRVIPCYGTNGFTEDHKEILRRFGSPAKEMTGRQNDSLEVEIAFDNDVAGSSGALALARELGRLGVERVTRVILPEGVKDINEFYAGGGRKEDYDLLERKEIEIALPLTASLSRESESKHENGVIHYSSGNRSYRVRAGDLESIRSLRVNIRLTVGEDYAIDVIDLYSHKSTAGYIRRMNKRFSIPYEELERDLRKILEEVERHIAKDEEQKELEAVMPVITPEERGEALRYLKNPDLVKMIIKDLEFAGCVGEDMNKILGYIVTVSRKLDQPLSMIIVSQSGAGKSNLADMLEAVTPKEECLHLSRITPQALYYMDRQALKRKVLVIEEKEGSRDADYSIRVLQSKEILRLAVPIKDPKTGSLKTSIFEVEGPVVIIETTTRTDLNPENLSRCFTVYLDESESQTRRIHDYQKRMKTAEGALEKRNICAIITKHQNIQRLLEPVNVIIPYVQHISFPSKWLRGRRDHQRFLNLIEAVTFLHQYQRARKRVVEAGGQGDTVYIESHPEDYRTAYTIARDVIGDSLAELMKPERDFYERTRRMREEREKKTFSRRDIREYTGLPDHLVRRMVQTLVEMEYFLVSEGKNGVKFEYMINPYPVEARDIIQGLTTPEELERRIKEVEIAAPFGLAINSTNELHALQPCKL